MPATPARLAHSRQRFIHGCGTAVLCVAAAAIGTFAAGLALSALNFVMVAQPELFAVAVFTALLTIFVRVAFKEPL